MGVYVAAYEQCVSLLALEGDDIIFYPFFSVFFSSTPVQIPARLIWGPVCRSYSKRNTLLVGESKLSMYMQ